MEVGRGVGGEAGREEPIGSTARPDAGKGTQGHNLESRFEIQF